MQTFILRWRIGGQRQGNDGADEQNNQRRILNCFPGEFEKGFGWLRRDFVGTEHSRSPLNIGLFARNTIGRIRL